MKLDLGTAPVSNYVLFAHSLKLYVASFLRVFPLALLLSCVFFLPQFFQFSSENVGFVFWTPANIVQLMFNVGAIFIFLGLLWRIWSQLLQKRDSFAEDFKVARKKILIVLASAAIQTLLLSMISYLSFGVIQLILQTQLFTTHFFVAFYLCVCTGVISLILILYLFLAFFFYIPLILVEDNGIIYSLKHSALLVFKNAWRVLILQISPWLCYLLVIIGLRYLFNLNIFVYDNAAAQNISFVIIIVKIILFSLFVPWFGAMLLVQLRDLELRKQFLL